MERRSRVSTLLRYSKEVPFVFVLCLLHIGLACVRLVSFIALHVITPLRLKMTGTLHKVDQAQIKADVASGRWSKRPHHVAVVFYQCRPVKNDVERLQRDILKLVSWSKELDISTYSLYDEDGFIRKHIEDILAPLPGFTAVDHKDDEWYTKLKVARDEDVKSAHVWSESNADNASEPSLDEADSSETNATTLFSADHSNTPHRSSSLTVNILTPRSGKDYMAYLSQKMASEYTPTTISALTSEAIRAKLDKTGLTEPDLLIVLGGPYLRLRGFPPWQIHLAEMYHHPSPAWLVRPALSYDIFRRALDVYGDAEMRFGR